MLYIPIKAVGKERPRYSSCTKSMYTPKKTREFEEIIRAHARAFMRANNMSTCTGPVAVDMIVHRKVPKSWTKDKAMKAVNGDIRPVVTPDGDNVLKAVFDGLNGTIYQDDKQVVESSYKQWYGVDDSIEVSFKEL